MGVSVLSNDLDRPLGTNRSAKSGGFRISGRQAFLGLLATSIIAGSTLLALEGRDFSTPAQEPDLAQQTSSASETDAPAKIAKAESQTVALDAGTPPSATGPKIIKVKRDDSEITGGITVRDPSKVTQDPRMAHIPDPDLIEKAQSGAIPMRAADGRRPLDVYARPWSGTRGAKVAIIIGGLGISQTATQNAVRNLPPEITLAFASQGNSISRWAQDARRNGHEILLQVPMEPFDYPNVDPGRGTLLVDADAAQNLEELHRSLVRMTNYTGILNYMGARFTSETTALQPIIKDLSDRGLMFVDDGTSARSQTADLVKNAKGAYATGDLVIDAVQDKNEIMKKLDELEASARASGSAIATGTGFDVTVEAVAAWTEQAKKRGVEIVGVSALANDSEK